MMQSDELSRRAMLASAGAALTTSLFTGRAKGANDRITVGFIGLGAMGSGNLEYAMKVPDAQPVAVCDVYQPHLDRAVATADKGGFRVKAWHDFRDLLADKSIDAVCVSTPDHWHAYMAIEACKAGKDVYVEKPASKFVEEGQRMVEAARKYNRVVQAGTMQRSGGYFKKAAELVSNGSAGEVTFCHAFQCGLTERKGFGNPADCDPPAGLDWDLWLGPAPKVPFNPNRWGVETATFPTFRYFWDYAGGAMTDWGVHLIDPIHQCFGDAMPSAVSGLGAKLYVEDNTETFNTVSAAFHYDKFVASYENRECNPMPMFRFLGGAGTVIHGTEATILVSRRGCWLVPNGKGEPQSWEKDRAMAAMNVPHWQNFLDCIRTRQKPTSDIETCVRSSTVCLLSNLAMRFQSRIDWDAKNWTAIEPEMRPHLAAKYREPWKLEV